MGQFPIWGCVHGKRKALCCSLSRTSIWDDDQTECQSLCLSIFSRGWGGEKAEGIGQISGSVPFCVLLQKLWLWEYTCIWGHLARFISLHMARYTCFVGGELLFSFVLCLLKWMLHFQPFRKKKVCGLWCWMIYYYDDLRIFHSWLCWMWDISSDPWASIWLFL